MVKLYAKKASVCDNPIIKSLRDRLAFPCFQSVCCLLCASFSLSLLMLPLAQLLLDKYDCEEQNPGITLVLTEGTYTDRAPSVPSLSGHAQEFTHNKIQLGTVKLSSSCIHFVCGYSAHIITLSLLTWNTAALYNMLPFMVVFVGLSTYVIYIISRIMGTTSFTTHLYQNQSNFSQVWLKFGTISVRVLIRAGCYYR